MFRKYEDRAWGVVHTRVAAEQRIQTCFEEFGIPTYIPMLYTKLPQGRTTKKRMFRGYLFAAWNRNERNMIVHFPGVTDIVDSTVNYDDAVIQDMEFVYKIENLSKTQDVSLRKDPVVGIVHTEIINNGPLSGLKGAWHKINGKNMFATVLNIMGMTFNAEIEEGSLIRR